MLSTSSPIDSTSILYPENFGFPQLQRDHPALLSPPVLLLLVPEAVPHGVWWDGCSPDQSLGGWPYRRHRSEDTKVLIIITVLSFIILILRYVDIFLGLSLLLSHLVLCYGSSQERRAPLTLFLILSMASLTLYWVWFAYLKYGKGDGEASKEVSGHDTHIRLGT